MAEEAILSSLKDIHLPPPIGWWPMAIGWYFLLGTFVCALFGIAYFFWKQYWASLPKKQALAILKEAMQAYADHQNAATICAQISKLLKRVALFYYPRAQVASMHGTKWVTFLDSTSKDLDFASVHTLLLETAFKANATEDVTPLVIKAQGWIKQRGKPCLN